jgi:predicted amidohydrolase
VNAPTYCRTSGQRIGICDCYRCRPPEPRKWPEMMGVCYDEPLAMSGLPLATIKEIEQ